MAGLMTGAIATGGLTFDVELMDIEQLNVRLSRGDFDVAKTSFAAAARLTDRVVLPVGSALGFGVGPLLLSNVDEVTPGPSAGEVLCPGDGTTATLLLRHFYPDAGPIRQVVFSDIMPSLHRGEGTFGVCIHEGRFTYRESSLYLVEDLGHRWEQTYHCPLPLGGLVARQDLRSGPTAAVVDVIRRSLHWALEQPERAVPTMQQYAQEMDRDVMMKHVDLYVNEWTVALGDVGRGAIERLFAVAGGRPVFAGS